MWEDICISVSLIQKSGDAPSSWWIGPAYEHVHVIKDCQLDLDCGTNKWFKDHHVNSIQFYFKNKQTNRCKYNK